jgi:hypothetical protein
MGNQAEGAAGAHDAVISSVITNNITKTFRK